MISHAEANGLLDRLSSSEETGSRFRAFAVALLAELPGYSWSGVYRLEGDTLVLDEYVGAQTDHTHIPVGRGVCGTAVAENRNQVVADVREIANYLSCSAQTRSEIVVLIRSGNDVLGQIDIDGHAVGAFDDSDEQFLTSVASLMAERWDPATLA